MNEQEAIREGSGGSMSAPSFSLKRLFFSMTLVAVGIGTATFGLSWYQSDLGPLLWAPCFACGCAMVGAGILSPFKQSWIGALTGLVLGALEALLMYQTQAR
jgi:hypothetical protein